MKTTTAVVLLLSISVSCLAQGPASDRQQFVRVEAPVIALTHVRVIDGTGAAPLEDQTIVITDGKIQSIASSPTANVPTGAQMLDLKGYTVLPGLVGVLSNGRLAANVFEHGEQLPAPLPRAWRHDDSDHRQRRAVYRS